MIRELTVVSGKGGTGKTSIAACLAFLADRPVIADADVDAADLHLILAPEVRECHEFQAGNEAVIRPRDCTNCGHCLSLCRFGAIREVLTPEGAPLTYVDPLACEGCGVCVRFCPVQAIDFPERRAGEWMISETRAGPLVHARLDPGSESSGKLVSIVRREARRLAEAEGRSTIIVDGPPGIGCPVIASVTGADKVLVVTEPTLAGEHDLARVLALVRHFEIPAAVVVNKWDIYPELADRIEEAAGQAGAIAAGRVRYDRSVTAAQMRSRAAVEIESAAAGDIRRLWKHPFFEDLRA